MRKILLATVLVVALTADGSALAVAAQTPNRTPALGSLSSTSKPGADRFENLRPAKPLPPATLPQKSAKCRLSCVKRRVASLEGAYSALAHAHNALIDKHNRLVDRFNDLNFAFYNCELLVDVTQYDGYLYDGGFIETALDFTVPGDFVDESMVVWDC